MATKLKPADKIDRLITIAAQECSDLGIALIFKKEEIDDEITLGSFSATSKELIVTTKNSNWVETLVHELAHLRQYREGKFIDEDPYGFYEEWLAGEIELDMAEVITYTRYCQECELDADRRAVQIFKDLKLKNAAGLKKYVQIANAHVYIYELARRYRKWTSSEKSPMRNKKVYGLLPTTFIDDVSHVPDDFEAAVADKCFD